MKVLILKTINPSIKLIISFFKEYRHETKDK